LLELEGTDMAKNRRTTAGTKQLNVEIEESLLEKVKAFVKARGESLRSFTELAFQRHMDNPPPPPAPIPPLPPVTAQEPGRKSAAKKGKK
jgi:hypothetical protein